MNQFYCSAPWTGLSLRNNNLITVCANSDWCYQVKTKTTLSEALNNISLQDFRSFHLNSSIVESCRLCKFRHDLGFKTMRDDFKSELEKNKTTFVSHATTISPSQIFNLDINLSDICNLKCRMCNSFCSFSWENDQTELARELNFISTPKKKAESLIQIDIEKFTNLKSIVLKGGEPLSNQKSIDFLKSLIDLNLHNSIHLSIFTNGFFVDQYIDLLAKFNKLYLSFSFEGIDRVFSYIRGGENYTFKKFVENVKLAGEFKNIQTNFMYTPQAYNIFDLSDSANFLWSEIRPKISNSLTIEDMKNIFSNILEDPTFLSTSALPLSIRKTAVDKIERSKVINLPIWKPIFNYLLVTENSKEYDKFIKYTRKLDSLRQQNIFDFIPEFKDTNVEKKYYEL